MSAQHKRHTRLPEDWDRSDPGLQFLYKQQRARERYARGEGDGGEGKRSAIAPTVFFGRGGHCAPRGASR